MRHLQLNAPKGRILVVAFLAVLAAALPLGVSAAGSVRTIVAFDVGVGDYPEGLAIDERGGIYVGITFTGRVEKITRNGARSTLATLPAGADGLVVGLAVDEDQNVYAALASFDPQTHGVWKISRAGVAKRIAALDPNGFPNGLAFGAHGELYVTDSLLGAIWRIPAGGGTAEMWLQDPLLASDGSASWAGANGIAFDHGHLIVSNTNAGSLVTVPIERDGSAGTPRLMLQDPKLSGADGFALDARGGIYVAMSVAGAANTIVRVRPDRSIESIASAADGLDYTAKASQSTVGKTHSSCWTRSASVRKYSAWRFRTSSEPPLASSRSSA